MKVKHYHGYTLRKADDGGWWIYCPVRGYMDAAPSYRVACEWVEEIRADGNNTTGE